MAPAQHFGASPVLSIEAGTTAGWEELADGPIGFGGFAASTPGASLLDKHGVNVDHGAERAVAALPVQ